MRRWVITTGKGELFVTMSHTMSKALVDFEKKWPGQKVASIAEATEFYCGGY